MKKGWKIALISIGSLIGLIIVTVVVALWLVLTPTRLTSIVNKLSDKFIICENHFDNVDLTFFKTFPYVGLEVNGFVLINPTEGAACDTVAYVKQLGVGFNVREFLKNKNMGFASQRNQSKILFSTMSMPTFILPPMEAVIMMFLQSRKIKILVLSLLRCLNWSL